MTSDRAPLRTTLNDNIGPKQIDGVSRLEKEVAHLRAKISRRDQTIVQLQTSHSSQTTTKDLELKLQDLIKRHEASKIKHSNEIKHMSAEKQAAKKEAETHHAKEVALVTKLADVRAKLALSEAENARSRQELASRPPAQSGPLVDEQTSWRKEKTTMEGEIKRLAREVARWMGKCDRLQEEGQKDASVKAENERYKLGWSVMAEQYAELYESLQLVQRTGRQQQARHMAERTNLQSQVDTLRARLETSTQNEQVLGQRLQSAETYIDVLNSAYDDVQDANKTLRSSTVGRSEDGEDVPPLEPMVDIAECQVSLDLATKHASLGQDALLESNDHINHLTAAVINLEQSVREAEAALSGLQTAHAQLDNDHKGLIALHAPCGASISQVRFELEQANLTVDSRGQEVHEVRVELRKADERCERQADLLKQANDNVSRATFAQSALEEEVEHLRNKYFEVAVFEERYNELLERQQLLETREAVAIEQAERVAMENAELMGHTNGSQKIGYVDGVRREMAMCRQELAATRYRLNIANDRIASLETEIAAYKTISPDSISGSQRTRVVRRQPEGGRLTTSMSASGARRLSVSGPGGARRFV